MKCLIQLTDLAIRKLVPPAQGQVTVWDRLPGFGIRVSQGGAKTFIVLVGSGSRHTIGRHPTISLSDARDEAKRILAEKTLGKHRPRSITWEDALKAYFDDGEQRVKDDDLRSRTLSDYTRLLKKHFAFGRRQLSEISSEEIIRRLARLSDAPSERNHALVALKVFLRWAQKAPRRYIDRNPCEGMVPSKRPFRKRVLTDKELAAIYRMALEGSHAFCHIVSLLILTGQRRGEIAALQHSWINQTERTITLPPASTKNGAEHTFPFGSAAGRILSRIEVVDATPHLFPASRSHVRGRPTTIFNGWREHKEALDVATGVSDWTLHDLRRTFATNLAALKVPPHVIERLLNHKFGSTQNQTDGIVSAVAEVYNRHLYLDEMRAAIERWEERLDTLARGA
jgi:integrase